LSNVDFLWVRTLALERHNPQPEGPRTAMISPRSSLNDKSAVSSLMTKRNCLWRETCPNQVYASPTLTLRKVARPFALWTEAPEWE